MSKMIMQIWYPITTPAMMVHPMAVVITIIPTGEQETEVMIILVEEAVRVVVAEVPGVDVAAIPGAEAEAVAVEITTNTDHWTIMELLMMHRMTGEVATVEVRQEMVTPWTIDLRFVLSSSNATNPNQPLHGSLNNIVVFQVFAYIRIHFLYSSAAEDHVSAVLFASHLYLLF